MLRTISGCKLVLLDSDLLRMNIINFVLTKNSFVETKFYYAVKNFNMILTLSPCYKMF